MIVYRNTESLRELIYDSYMNKTPQDETFIIEFFEHGIEFWWYSIVHKKLVKHEAPYAKNKNQLSGIHFKHVLAIMHPGAPEWTNDAALALTASDHSTMMFVNTQEAQIVKDV